MDVCAAKWFCLAGSAEAPALYHIPIFKLWSASALQARRGYDRHSALAFLAIRTPHADCEGSIPPADHAQAILPYRPSCRPRAQRAWFRDRAAIIAGAGRVPASAGRRCRREAVDRRAICFPASSPRSHGLLCRPPLPQPAQGRPTSPFPDRLGRSAGSRRVRCGFRLVHSAAAVSMVRRQIVRTASHERSGHDIIEGLYRTGRTMSVTR